MNENPYLPPTTAIVPDVTTPLWKTLARIAIFVYGCAYCGIIVYGHIADSYEWDWLEVSILIVIGVVDALTCYGIFALAFRSLRHPSLYPIWRVFVWLLPPLTIGEAVWELSQPDEMDTEDTFMLMVIGLPIVLIVSTPAFICNFLLVSRLRLRRNSSPLFELNR